MIKEVFFNDFRNLKDKKISLSKSFNLIYGQNARKNIPLMEAIYFGATGKSFRTKNFWNDKIWKRVHLEVYIKLFNGEEFFN